MSETDEAYWTRILELRDQGDWQGVMDKAASLLERWPRSEWRADALAIKTEAGEAIAIGLYEQVQKELGHKRFEEARSILEGIRADYPSTAASARAVRDLRSLDKVIAEARRRAVGNGKWRVSEEVSPIDDSTNVYVSLLADEKVRGRFGDWEHPSLWIRCKENRTEVFIKWGLYLGLDTTRMTHRLDDQQARKLRWNLSTDNNAVFYRGDHVGFAKELMNSGRLFAEITPYRESPVNTFFSLPGLENAIHSLRAACSW